MSFWRYMENRALLIDNMDLFHAKAHQRSEARSALGAKVERKRKVILAFYTLIQNLRWASESVTYLELLTVLTFKSLFSGIRLKSEY
ncbi:MAG: hypothetical protein EA343_25015 [Nodularia sp. (in: Bacteria)]|nr:MAG: hypothetical protein EA343_25015 [Nodularia sp. (in: cyanobacteria)]